MYSDHPIGQAEHDAWFAAIPGDRRRAYWMIEIDGAPAGLLDLYDIQPDHGRASWGYYLADPQRRGKGAGAYVQYRLLRHVFDVMALQKLWCEVLSTNLTALNLYLSFGFQKEALFRRHVRRDQGFVDAVGLGLLAEEWPQVRARAEQRLAAAGYDVTRGPDLIEART